MLETEKNTYILLAMTTVQMFDLPKPLRKLEVYN